MTRLAFAASTPRLLSLTASLFLSLLAPIGAAGAGPQLFKCVEGGRTVYQQQACPVSSQPEAAASGALVSKAAASEPAAKIARVRPSSPPASSALATPR